MRERVGVRVPQLIESRDLLNKINAGFDQPAGHEQGPTERIVAIAVKQARFSLMNVEGPAHPLLGQQRYSALMEAIETSNTDRLIQIAALGINILQKVEPRPECADAFRDRQVGGVKNFPFGL